MSTPKLQSQLMGNYCEFCRHSALPEGNPASVLKFLMSNVKSCEPREIYKRLYSAGDFIAWEYTDTASQNTIGSFPLCIRLVQYLEFPEADQRWKTQHDSVPVVPKFRDDLSACKMSMELHHVLRMFILHNLRDLLGANVLEQYAGSVLDRPTRDEVTNFVIRVADYRHEKIDYEGAIGWVLGVAQVDEQFFSDHRAYKQQRETIESVMKAKFITSSSGRVRLSDKLQRTRTTTSVTTEHGTVLTGEAMDTFDGWCTRVRFPNTISLQLKRRLYAIMSMPDINHAVMVNALTQSRLADEVCKHAIARPDEKVLPLIIESLSIQMEPFKELIAFQTQCFRGFAQHNIREMTILRYMQLYVAAYQHRELWKACWAHIYPMLTHQIIRDVEAFVKANPLNEGALAAVFATEADSR